MMIYGLIYEKFGNQQKSFQKIDDKNWAPVCPKKSTIASNQLLEIKIPNVYEKIHFIKKFHYHEIHYYTDGHVYSYSKFSAK